MYMYMSMCLRACVHVCTCVHVCAHACGRQTGELLSYAASQADVYRGRWTGGCMCMHTCGTCMRTQLASLPTTPHRSRLPRSMRRPLPTFPHPHPPLTLTPRPTPPPSPQLCSKEPRRSIRTSACGRCTRSRTCQVSVRLVRTLPSPRLRPPHPRPAVAL